MTNFIYPISSEIDGPFLLDRSQLENLDKVLKEEWERFEEDFKQTLDEAVENEFNESRSKEWNGDKSDEALRAEARNRLEVSYNFRKSRHCSIILDNGTIAKVLDFTSAFREPDLLDKDPSGFIVSMESGQHKCYITLSGKYASLKVEVEPQADYFVQQTLITLKNWQDSVRPSIWESLWRKFSPYIWLIWISAVFMSFIIIDSHNENLIKFSCREQARTLFTNGIALDQQGKALQLLLANVYNIAPNNTLYIIPNWFYLFFIGGGLYSIAFSIRPNVSIAIGKGVRKVRFWRIYSKFILYTFPAFIFTTFFWPKLDDFLKHLF